MMLNWLQKSGGKPIALMGGGTTRVGDPSGKDETRQLRTVEEIEANKNGMKRVFAKFLKFGEGRTDALMVDNAEWLAPLNYIEFLRDVGRHFSVNRMLTMDSAKLRLEREQELSFIEFNYMLLQAYDFVELARRYGCNLQMGGSDQWGNIVTGIDLGRRMGVKEQLYALTCPLLTTASGAKMGKTAAGAVWLNEAAALRLRLLAILAQHRGRRRGALPEAVHDAADRRNRASCQRSAAPRSTKPRRCSPPRQRRWFTAAKKPRRGRDRAQDLRAGRTRVRSADSRDQSRRPRSRHRRVDRIRESGARRIEWRGAPANPGRRLESQRRGGCRVTKPVSNRRCRRRVASSSYRSARRSTCF